MKPTRTKHNLLVSPNDSRSSSIRRSPLLDHDTFSSLIRIKLHLVDPVPDKELEVRARDNRIEISISSIGARDSGWFDVRGNPECIVGVAVCVFDLFGDTNVVECCELNLYRLVSMLD